MLSSSFRLCLHVPCVLAGSLNLAFALALATVKVSGLGRGGMHRHFHFSTMVEHNSSVFMPSRKPSAAKCLPHYEPRLCRSIAVVSGQVYAKVGEVRGRAQSV